MKSTSYDISMLISKLNARKKQRIGCNCHQLKSILIGLFLCGLPFSLLFGQASGDAYTLRPLRITRDFEITPQLKNPRWHKAQPVYISHEFTPNDQAPAPVQTTVRVLYSNDYLYIGFWAHDPEPSKIRAHITDRDGIGQDDFVLVTLDPFNTNQQAYELAVNPKGVQLDAKFTPYGENFNFDMLWESRAAVSDSGYTAVMKIPFKSIHFPKAAVQHWSINFLRVYPRSKRYQLFGLMYRLPTLVSFANKAALRA